MTIDYFLRIWISLNGKPKLTVQLITVSKIEFLNNNIFFTFIKNKMYEKTIFAYTLIKFYHKSTRC